MSGQPETLMSLAQEFIKVADQVVDKLSSMPLAKAVNDRLSSCRKDVAKALYAPKNVSETVVAPEDGMRIKFSFAPPKNDEDASSADNATGPNEELVHYYRCLRTTLARAASTLRLESVSARSILIAPPDSDKADAERIYFDMFDLASRLGTRLTNLATIEKRKTVYAAAESEIPLTFELTA